MVSWYADGQVSNFYSDLTGVGRDLLLASPGSVDTNYPTRLHYNKPPGVGATYDYIYAVARLNFTAGEAAALTGGQRLTSTMFVANSNLFPTGNIPTPSEILAKTTALLVYRSEQFTMVAGDKVLVIKGPRAQELDPASKYWVLVCPTKVSNAASNPSTANDPVLDNEFGQCRSVSVLTNRSPVAPTIVSPVGTTVQPPGSSFELRIDAKNDPDYFPGGGNQLFLYWNINGLQIQRAPFPSPGQAPVWGPMKFITADEFPPGTINQYLSQTDWFIDEANATENTEHAFWQFEWLNRGAIDVRTAAVDITAIETIPNTLNSVGSLPTGDWLIRIRSFDPGGDSIPAQPANFTNGNFTPETYPSFLVSPWSEPVRVIVPSQVPPPVPASPIDNIALTADTPVALSWFYRNTHEPPFPQAQRTVEIRAVGAPLWTTLASGASSEKFLVISSPPEPLLRSWNFESAAAGVDGWTFSGGNLVRSTAQAHSGLASLKFTPGVTARAAFTPVTPGLSYNVNLWTLDQSSGTSLISLVFKNSAGNTVGSTSTTVNPTNAWQQVSVTLTAPGNAASVEIVSTPGSADPVYIDDVVLSHLGAPSIFTLVATTLYEWRVRVTDSQGVVSAFSSSAFFWVVPVPASGDMRPLPAGTIDGATLGCGKHRVFVYRRGGKIRVGEITQLSYVDWSRVRDDVSDSRIVVSGWDVDCGNLLAKLQTWAYEVVIFRDNGFGPKRVWEGPITLLTYEKDRVVIQAKDVMAFPYRRIIKQQINDSGSSPTAGRTVVKRATQILQNVLATDDPNVLAYLQPLEDIKDAKQYRSIPAYSRTAFEEIDDMAANSGLDYTAVGRAILLWGTKRRIGTLPEFRDKDLGATPIVSEYGMSFANRYVVSDGNGVYGEADRLDENDEDPTYGLVEMLSSSWASDSPADDGDFTQAGLATIRESFAKYSEKSIADRYPPPVVVRVPDNTTLNPSTVLDIQQLVPGVVVPLRSTGTLRQIVADQKLDLVKVVETDGAEVITITLSPFSDDDANMEEGA